MANTDSRVTIHMAASLDGFIARKDGRVDLVESSAVRNPYLKAEFERSRVALFEA